MCRDRTPARPCYALGAKIIGRGDVGGGARVVDAATGAPIAFDTPFWFAVATFRPGIRVVDG